MQNLIESRISFQGQVKSSSINQLVEKTFIIVMVFLGLVALIILPTLDGNFDSLLQGLVVE